ncbi:hypothetical protein DL98DRAFT_519127 [Cadophora sp. DSE1049]|nr:hypothetical protein DL98DRAFT_519127 [Cadophora sp. DSE1049]
MGDIYSRATEVLIWLGPYREEVEHFVYTIRELLPLITEPSNRRRLAPWFKHESLFDDSFWEECFYMGSPLGRLTKFALFYASCRWFSRAWTMQETFLARRSRMFCGEVIISVSDAIDLANVLASCKWHSEINISLDKEGLVSNLSWLNELAAFSSFDYVRQEEFDQHRNRWNEDSSAVHALAVLLSRYRYSGCSDPRDKVYSLLSIVNGQSFQPSVFNFIKPDYTVSVEEVFTKVTKLVLEKSRSLDYLAEKRLNLDNNSSLSLPSWVVDHSLCRGVTTIIPGAICKPRYDACLCGSTTYPQFSVTDSKIHCHGSRFDVVADIMTPMTAPPESATGKFPSLSFWTFFLSLPPFINGRPRFDVVWKTLTVGANPDDSKIWVEGHFKTWMMFQIIELAKPTHGPASSSVLRDVMNQLGSSSSTAEQNLYHLAAAQLDRDDDYCVVKDDWIWGAMEFREAAATIVKERRLFTTERGLLAKTTRTLRKGDEVWMLCDAHVPFVLRPTARTGEYEVIGDCYVNGFMNGEMLEDRWNVRENIGSLTIV